MKEELLYGRHDVEKMTVEEVKILIRRYFINYWNNRKICSANEGLLPMVNRKLGDYPKVCVNLQTDVR